MMAFTFQSDPIKTPPTHTGVEAKELYRHI